MARASTTALPGQPVRRHRHPLESVDLGEAVKQRKRAGLTVEPELLVHISPLGWAHILLTGEYRWASADSDLSVRFRPLLESTRKRVKENSKGILISLFYLKIQEQERYHWYTFDCASGCFWNSSCLELVGWTGPVCE